MHAKSVQDIIALVHSAPFHTWHQQYLQCRQDITRVQMLRATLQEHLTQRRLHVDALVHMADEHVFRAGDWEDQAMHAQSEATEIENEAFESLSAFEQQRMRSTRAWVAFGGGDQKLENRRQRVAHAKSQHKAANALATHEQRVAVLQRDLTDAEQLRDALWQRVQQDWQRAFRKHLERGELSYRARRERADAERTLLAAQRERGQIEELLQEVETYNTQWAHSQHTMDTLLEYARTHFQTIIFDAFLYWARGDIPGTAICVPLINEPYALNIQVQALSLYQVECVEGLDRLVPIHENGSAELRKSAINHA